MFIPFPTFHEYTGVHQPGYHSACLWLMDHRINFAHQLYTGYIERDDAYIFGVGNEVMRILGDYHGSLFRGGVINGALLWPLWWSVKNTSFDEAPLEIRQAYENAGIQARGEGRRRFYLDFGELLNNASIIVDIARARSEAQREFDAMHFQSAIMWGKVEESFRRAGYTNPFVDGQVFQMTRDNINLLIVLILHQFCVLCAAVLEGYIEAANELVE